MKNLFAQIGIIIFLGVILLKPVLAAQTTYAIDEDRSLLEFSFRSTLHKVKGEARHFNGTFYGGSKLIDVLRSGEVDVDTGSLQTHNAKRDEQMLLMFESERFPEIHYAISEIIVPKPAVDGRGEITLKGQLTIKDKSKQIAIPAVVQKTQEGLILSGDVDLSLKEFNLRPPSVIMVIRVFDTVHVHFKTLLKETPS